MYSVPQQKLMIRPWQWLYGFVPGSDEALGRYIPKACVHWTSSARSGLFLLLEALRRESARQLSVTMPAFTCDVVREAVRSAGARILYYDSAVTAELVDIEQALDRKPDVLLVCYNFGYLPEQMGKIAALCRKNKTILIEDCAHALGAEQDGVLAGGFGDYALYSFGITKNIGFSGGILASNTRMRLPKPKGLHAGEILGGVTRSIIGPLVLNFPFFPVAQPLLARILKARKSSLPRRHTCSGFTRNVVRHLAKSYGDVLERRRSNHALLAGKVSAAACLYYHLTPKDKSAVVEFAESRGIELDGMHSYEYLPETAREGFPKAERAAGNFLAFALLRSREEINRIKQILP